MSPFRDSHNYIIFRVERKIDMTGKYLTWDELQQQSPKQTVAIVTYTWDKKKHMRIFLKGWMSREEAWNWCQANDMRHMVTYRKDQSILTKDVRLLRLAKVIRELAAEKSSDISAILVA